MPAFASRIAARLSYANVVATIALFISLGGASGAVVSLPPDSVGPQQLRPGAVSTNALAFPLQVQSFVGGARYLPETSCPEGPPDLPGGSCEERLAEGKPLGQLRLRTPGRIALTAVVALGTTGGDSVTSAIVQLGLFVDGIKWRAPLVKFAKETS